MNANLSVFVIYVEAIIYFLLYNLHDCTFKQELRWAKQVRFLKHNQLKIKTVKNKASINKSYLHLFVPHLFVPLLCDILN